ncbi:type II toxin-antitoxin system death-on-curing family toxin [Heyndrickxia coagulans]|uniref:type II toxin-antitoxin system death-on-curing family toxin n=1 Tax=Heyndrickxia TaxID=2837504 RepID=UPI0030FA8447
MEARHLNAREVAAMNAALIMKYTPAEQIGVKDQHLLESAVNRSKASAFGEDAYPTVWLKAAALFESLAKNHAFHNSNKRTAFLAVYVFLRYNGYELSAPPKVAEDFTVELVIANPPMPLTKVADWLESNCK